MNRELSDRGAAFLRLHEGFVSKWYLDPVGVPTIGTGMTWRSAAFREWWGKNKPGQAFARGATITKAENDDALRYMMAKEYGLAVNKFLGKMKVEQHVFDAMCSMVWNCGPGALKWRWAQSIKAGRIEEAASRLRGTAVTARGRRLAGLVRRRKEEALLLEKGIYTGVGNVPAEPPAPVDPLSDGLLVRGERGQAVAELILQLHELGYYEGALDDLFGPATQKAVMDFQRATKIKVDGIVGEETRATIAAELERKKKTELGNNGDGGGGSGGSDNGVRL